MRFKEFAQNKLGLSLIHVGSKSSGADKFGSNKNTSLLALDSGRLTGHEKWIRVYRFTKYGKSG
jgi:hypothetical protein